MRTLLPLLLLLTASCQSLSSSSSISRAEAGGLTIENRTYSMVVVAGKWFDDEEEMHCAFEVVLPGRGHQTVLRQEDSIPAGLELRFANRGPGFAATMERCGLASASDLSGAVADASYELRSNGNGMISRTHSSNPSEEGELEQPQQSWEYQGGVQHLVIEDDGERGIRVIQQ